MMGDLLSPAIRFLVLISCLLHPSVSFTQHGIRYNRRPIARLLAQIEPSDQALLDAIKNFTPSPTDAAHVFHGRGGLYPGCEHLTVDWFPPVWLITSFQPIFSTDHWQTALAERWSEVAINGEEELTWVYQDRSVTPTQTHVMAGEIPSPHIVIEHGNKYVVHIAKGQNHGLFLDMSKGREWIQEHAKDKRVLNLFAYSCAFSVAALKGGATEVINMDMANGPLKMGQRNHNLNDVSSDARFFNHDIFKSWGKIKKLGPYDLIVCDPPSYQKGSFVAKKDYQKVIRRLPSLLTPGGYAMLCLNAPELDTNFMKAIVVKEAPALEFVERLENPESYPVTDSERALKVLLYQLTEEEG